MPGTRSRHGLLVEDEEEEEGKEEKVVRSRGVHTRRRACRTRPVLPWHRSLRGDIRLPLNNNSSNALPTPFSPPPPPPPPPPPRRVGLRRKRTSPVGHNPPPLPLSFFFYPTCKTLERIAAPLLHRSLLPSSTRRDKNVVSLSPFPPLPPRRKQPHAKKKLIEAMYMSLVHRCHTENEEKKKG